MEPVALIVTALGAAATRQAASAAVKDAARTLKTQVRRRLAGRSGAEYVFAQHEEAPETWQASLASELASAGADQDAELLSAAQALLDLVDKDGTRTGKYAVSVNDSQGVQIGDYNSQVNVFNSPPSGGTTGR